MTDEAMSPLRRRIIEDMTIRKSAEDPARYIRTIKDFAAFLGRSPDTASFEDAFSCIWRPARDPDIMPQG
jgi:integrase/recombinase XerD